jgi:hypothetical protein
VAKSSELFGALLETLHPVMPAGASRELCLSTVREQLGDEYVLRTAQQIIDGERTNQKVTDAQESDLWEALAESLCESFKGGGGEAVAGDANAARNSFVARLKVIAEEANR